MILKNADGEGSSRPDAGNALARWMERHGGWLLLVILAGSCLQLLWRSAIKPLWFDEMFTWNLAQQPTWHLYRSGLAADGNPPLYSALAWIMAKFSKSGPLPMRLPSLVSYFAASALLYRIVRIRLGVLTALIAVFLFNANPAVTVYAIEARPYALVLLFTTLAFAGWQAATDAQEPRRWAKWLITVSVVGAIFSHHYGIVSVGFPIFCGEIARTIRRRRFDVPLIAAASSGLAALIFTVPLARETQLKLLTYSNYRRGFPHSWPSADYFDLLTIPGIGISLLIAFVGLCLWFLYSRRKGSKAVTVPLGWAEHEVIALFGSALTLLLVYLTCSLTTGYYNGLRYGIGAFMGIVALCVTPFTLLQRQAKAILLLALVFPFFAVLPLEIRHGRADAHDAACIRALPDEPIVIARGLSYPEDWYYASARTRQRLFFLTDLEYAKHQIYNVPEIAMIVQKPIFPMTVTDYAGFLRSHPTFLLLESGIPDQDYLVRHLLQDRFTLSPVSVPACRTASVQRVSSAPIR